jgi:WXG100 family type VII secretion target
VVDLLIQPEELYKTAQDFLKASKDLMAINKRLNKSTGELEKKWAGASRQVFYKRSEELKQYMEGMSGLMKNISQEMQAMAERFERADK